MSSQANQSSAHFQYHSKTTTHEEPNHQPTTIDGEFERKIKIF